MANLLDPRRTEAESLLDAYERVAWANDGATTSAMLERDRQRRRLVDLITAGLASDTDTRYVA